MKNNAFSQGNASGPISYTVALWWYSVTTDALTLFPLVTGTEAARLTALCSAMLTDGVWFASDLTETDLTETEAFDEVRYEKHSLQIHQRTSDRKSTASRLPPKFQWILGPHNAFQPSTFLWSIPFFAYCFSTEDSTLVQMSLTKLETEERLHHQ
jgi:hypothetical protein